MSLGAVRMILLEAIAQNLKTIAAGVAAGDPRVMGRVLRSFAQLRRTMEPEVLKALLEDWVRSWSLGGVSLLEIWYKYIQLLSITDVRRINLVETWWTLSSTQEVHMESVI